MKVLVFFAVLLVCVASVRIGGGEDLFQKFVTKFNKNYKTPEEYSRRLAIFQDNLITINKQNAEARASGFDTQFGVTKFSDLTKQEFRKYLGYKKISPSPKEDINYQSFAPIPTSLDWRTKGAVTPVKNQEQCGSCWAFSATEGVESGYFIGKAKLFVLSPQQIVSCDTNDGGCDGGDLPTAFQYVQQAGMEPASIYPYTSGNGDSGTCKYDQSQVVVQITGFQYATTTGNETAMQAAMLTKGPLSICVDASTWQNYQGGVITHDCGDDLDHCVQITGWASTSNNNTPYWVIKNSWGSDWGISGYIWVARNKDECGVAGEAIYVTV